MADVAEKRRCVSRGAADIICRPKFFRHAFAFQRKVWTGKKHLCPLPFCTSQEDYGTRVRIMGRAFKRTKTETI